MEGERGLQIRKGRLEEKERRSGEMGKGEKDNNRQTAHKKYTEKVTQRNKTQTHRQSKQEMISGKANSNKKKAKVSMQMRHTHRTEHNRHIQPAKQSLFSRGVCRR